MEFTEPFEAEVVAVAQSAELAMPKRVSLPSMLPPASASFTVWSTPRAAKAGLPFHSSYSAGRRRPTKRIVIAASTAHPWRVSPTILPKV
jgi:hypothetical protein